MSHGDRWRILQVLEAFEGGTRQHLLDLATGLDPRRYTVEVAVSLERPGASRAAVEPLRAAGVIVHEVAMVRSPSPRADLAALARLRRLLAAKRFDLVHGHSSKGGFLGRLAARLAGLPALYTPNAFYFQAPEAGPLQRRAAIALERLAAGWGEGIVCVSAGEAAAARAAGLDRRARMMIIPNGIDLARLTAALDGRGRAVLGASEEELVVLAIGRQAPQKGDADLLRAWPAVAAGCPAARLYLAGDGPLRPALEALAASLPIEHPVRFLPLQTNVPRLLAAADVFVLPSLYEGCPYTLLEAMACGTCCVATATAGSRDVLRDGVTGRLVPVGRPPALAAALLEVLARPADRRRLGEAARRVARSRHDVTAMIAATQRLYDEILTARRSLSTRDAAGGSVPR